MKGCESYKIIYHSVPCTSPLPSPTAHFVQLWDFKMDNFFVCVYEPMPNNISWVECVFTFRSGFPKMFRTLLEILEDFLTTYEDSRRFCDNSRTLQKMIR